MPSACHNIQCISLKYNLIQEWLKRRLRTGHFEIVNNFNVLLAPVGKKMSCNSNIKLILLVFISNTDCNISIGNMMLSCGVVTVLLSGCQRLSATVRVRERERELPANLSVLVANSLACTAHRSAQLYSSPAYISLHFTTNLLLR